MVILDSDHARDHVLQELRLYAGLVTPGAYLIVEDSNVNGHPVLPEHGPGPMEALREFLGGTREFAVDAAREKFFLTFNPKGFLKKLPKSGGCGSRGPGERAPGRARRAGMSRVLVLCAAPVGERMAGPAIRCVEIARALAAGHRVTLAAPGAAALSGEPFCGMELEQESLGTLVGRHDVAVLSGYLLRRFPSLRRAACPLAVDVYDPFVLENLEIHRDRPLPEREVTHRGDLGVQIELLRRGDFFLCASERQRDFWLGMLLALNRIEPSTYDADRAARRLIDVVPFGIPAAPPASTGRVLKVLYRGSAPTTRSCSGAAGSGTGSTR